MYPMEAEELEKLKQQGNGKEEIDLIFYDLEVQHY
jgi:hypothetical protein